MARAYSAFSCAICGWRLAADGSTGATSAIHVAAVGLPEAVHRSLGGARVVRLGALASHVDDGDLVARRRRPALHESAHAAVLHGHVARRADQVQLPEPPPTHLGRVVLEAEIGPVQLHGARTLRYDLAHGEAVLDLLEHEGREHGQDLQPYIVAELVHALQQARIGQLVVLPLRADALLPVGRARAVVGAVDRVARVVRAVWAHEDTPALREPGDPERAEEGVEQARVIRVLHVFDVELPVVRQQLDEAPEHSHAPAAQHARDAPEDGLAQVGLDGRRILAQAREDEAVERLGPELSRAVLGLGKPRRHAAAPVGAFLECDAGEIALVIVRPRVIDALEVLRRPMIVQRYKGAAVGAAVLESANRAVLGADHDHRHFAQERGPEVAGTRQVRIEADEAPRRALEDAAELGVVGRLVLVDPEGHAGERGAGPGADWIRGAHGRSPAPPT